MNYNQKFILILLFKTIEYTTSQYNQNYCYTEIHSQKLQESNISRLNPQQIFENYNDQIIQQDNHNFNRNLQDNNDQLQIDIQNPQPIRITIDYQIYNKSLNSQQIYAVKQGINIITKYLKDLITVFPETYNLIIQDHREISNGKEGNCILLQEQNKIPIKIQENYKLEGIPNSDLHIFILLEEQLQNNFQAYSNSCQWHHDRSTIGYIVLNQNYLHNLDFQDNGYSFKINVETLLHEFFHILGFLKGAIPYFRDENGQRIPNIEKFYFLKEKRNILTNILATKYVKQYTQSYFGCSSAEGAQLENQGNQGTKGSHWERLIFYNEIMNPTQIQSDSVTSIFTLAYFKDSNFYADINLDMAESIQWGQNKGCNFLDYCDTLQSEFLESEEQDQCSFHHFGQSKPIIEKFTDQCNVSVIYQNTNCIQPEDISPNQQFTHEVNSLDSKCFISDIIDTQQQSQQSYRCYENECNEQGLHIKIQKNNQDFSIICQKGGIDNGKVKQISEQSGLQGTLTCPENVDQFCQFPKPCKNYCSQNGYCLHQNGSNICHCLKGFSGEDCSIQCQGVLHIQQCIDKCPLYHYQNPNNNMCEQCHFQCNTKYCKNNTLDGCTFCPQDQWNYQNKCLQKCPQNTFSNKINGKCEQCDKKCQNGCIRKFDNCLIKPVNYINNQDFIKKVYYDSQGNLLNNQYVTTSQSIQESQILKICYLQLIVISIILLY